LPMSTIISSGVMLGAIQPDRLRCANFWHMPASVPN
jgi:hypothetical protein